MKTTSRKSFLKQTSLALGALFTPKLMEASAPNPIVALPDLQDIHRAFTISKDIAFLNSATLGPSPKQVTTAMMQGHEDVTVNTLFGRKQTEARDTLANFVGAKSTEIALTHNTTNGINLMTWGLKLNAGDEIILSYDEHAGNASSWLHRAKKDKLVIKSFKLGKTALETLANLKKVVTAKTKVFAIPHVSCAIGQVLPIKEISSYAKTKNIITCIDGAQALGMLPLNLKDLDVDYYATCCHKWLLAPQGTGFLYINSRNLGKLQPIFFGAEGTKNFLTNTLKPSLQEVETSAKSFEFGTQSGALLAGVIEACQFQNSLGKVNIENRIKELSNFLYEQLSIFTKEVQILTPSEAKSRSGIIGFRFKTKDNTKFKQFAADDGFVVRYIAENNLDSIRISTHIFNTQDQLESFVELLKKYIA